MAVAAASVWRRAWSSSIVVHRVECWQRRFDKLAEVPSDGWERRFARGFRLGYAAARLARRFGIVDWSKAAIDRALTACYRDARAAVPDVNALEDHALRRVQRRLKSGRNLIDLRTRAEPAARLSTQQADGFVKRLGTEGDVFMIKPQALKRWLRSETGVSTIATRLDRDGFLVTDPKRADTRTVQASVAGVNRRCRYYVIRRKFVEARIGASEPR